MANPFIVFRSSVNAGDLVVCHQVKGFDGQKMAARVLDDSEMHRPAQSGMAWVRETGLSAKGERWVTEWPIALME